MEQGIFVLYGGGVVTKGLVLGLSQCVQLDMNIDFPFSRHESILEALKGISEGEGF